MKKENGTILLNSIFFMLLAFILLLSISEITNISTENNFNSGKALKEGQLKESLKKILEKTRGQAWFSDIKFLKEDKVFNYVLISNKKKINFKFDKSRDIKLCTLVLIYENPEKTCELKSFKIEGKKKKFTLDSSSSISKRKYKAYYTYDNLKDGNYELLLDNKNESKNYKLLLSIIYN